MSPKKHYPPPALGPGGRALTKRQRAEGIAKWAELLHGKRRPNPPSLPIIDVKAEQPSKVPRENPPTPVLDQLFQGNELPAKTNPKKKKAGGTTHRRGKGKPTRPAKGSKRPPVSIDTRPTLEARGRSEPPVPASQPIAGSTADSTAGTSPVTPGTPLERPPPGATQLRSDGDQVVTPLEPRQQRFVEEYLIDLNAAGAARRAGYAKASAKQQGHDLLTKPDVQDAIAKARAALSVRTQITLDDITRELAKMGFANLADYFNLTNEGGDPYIDLTVATRDQLAALQQITVEDYVEGRGEDARQVKRVAVKLCDKKGSLGLLSDLLGHSPKKQFNLSGTVKVETDGDPLAVAIRRMETADLLAYDALAKQQEALLAKSRPAPAA
jgi:phage terminase small subunit